MVIKIVIKNIREYPHSNYQGQYTGGVPSVGKKEVEQMIANDFELYMKKNGIIGNVKVE